MATRIPLGIVIALTAVWAMTALWIQHPFGKTGAIALIVLAAAVMLACLVLLRRRLARSLGLFVIACAALSIWWTALTPSNDRDWALDVARQTHGESDGGIVTLNNVRDFDWRSDADFTPRWETRKYDLDKIRSVDLILSYWGSPAIAHTLVSFGFDGGEHVVFSVEIRKERHEAFSEIGGFFKEFELSVIAADERDIIGVRTNVRGEDDYLYRVQMAPRLMRSLFLAYVDQANELVTEPRFYNTVTANCTTIVYQMARHLVEGLPLDYRILLSGYLPEYLYDIGALSGADSVSDYRARGRITERARAIQPGDDFSRAIRAGVPGIR